jgi:hypothetical protein
MIDDFTTLKEDISEYIEVRLEQIKLNLAEISSRIVSNALTAIVFTGLAILILLFLSFAAALFIGSLLNSIHLGFLCVAGFYFMLLITFFLFRKYLIDGPVIRSVISMFFPKSSEDEKK